MSAEWEKFIESGKGRERYVCTLSVFLSAHLKPTSREVKIGHEYVLKALEKHGLGVEHLPVIALAIAHGEAAHDRAKHLTFLYWSDGFERWFQVTIKCCTERRALYVTTFHAIGADDVTRRRKKYEKVWPLK